MFAIQFAWGKTVRLLLVAGCLIFLLYGVGQGNTAQASPPSLDTLVNEAKQAFTSGDKSAALKLFENAARQGHPEAQYQLGLMYMKGWGVPRNVREAHFWLRQAEGRGHAQAGQALAVLVSQLDVETRKLLESSN